MSAVGNYEVFDHVFVMEDGHPSNTVVSEIIDAPEGKKFIGVWLVHTEYESYFQNKPFYPINDGDQWRIDYVTVNWGPGTGISEQDATVTFRCIVMEVGC